MDPEDGDLSSVLSAVALAKVEGLAKEDSVAEPSLGFARDPETLSLSNGRVEGQSNVGARSRRALQKIVARRDETNRYQHTSLARGATVCSLGISFGPGAQSIRAVATP